MLKVSQIQTFTQKSDFIQTTFDLKVWIQTFAKNSDQSGRPGVNSLKLVETSFKWYLKTIFELLKEKEAPSKWFIFR